MYIIPSYCPEGTRFGIRFKLYCIQCYNYSPWGPCKYESGDKIECDHFEKISLAEKMRRTTKSYQLNLWVTKDWKSVNQLSKDSGLDKPYIQRMVSKLVKQQKYEKKIEEGIKYYRKL